MNFNYCIFYIVCFSSIYTSFYYVPNINFLLTVIEKVNMKGNTKINPTVNRLDNGNEDLKGIIKNVILPLNFFRIPVEIKNLKT